MAFVFISHQYVIRNDSQFQSQQGLQIPHIPTHATHTHTQHTHIHTHAHRCMCVCLCMHMCGIWGIDMGEFVGLLALELGASFLVKTPCHMFSHSRPGNLTRLEGMRNCLGTLVIMPHLGPINERVCYLTSSHKERKPNLIMACSLYIQSCLIEVNLIGSNLAQIESPDEWAILPRLR